MEEARIHTCVICGRAITQKEMERHHPFGRLNVPAITLPVCLYCHDQLTERLRCSGVELEHEIVLTAEQLERNRLWAIVRGLTDMHAELAAQHRQPQAAQLLERVGVSLGRLLTPAEPAEDGVSFGPDPNGNYRRAAERKRKRKPISTRMKRAAKPALTAPQLGDLFSFHAETAQLALGKSNPEHVQHVSRLNRRAGQTKPLLGKLAQLDAPQIEALNALTEQTKGGISAIVDALTSVHNPHATTALQLERVRVATLQLQYLEAVAFSFFDDPATVLARSVPQDSGAETAS